MTFNVIASRVYISIHALLAESDGLTAPANVQRRKFLSTLSLRRATCGLRLHDGRCAISIHALLAESDGCWPRRARPSCYFYPRSPCGERRLADDALERLERISIHALLAESDKTRSEGINRNIAFLSTLSLRRATLATWQSDYICRISIHALLAESDPPNLSSMSERL